MTSVLANLRVGHAENEAYRTGLTVFLFDKQRPMRYQLCGSAPGTRDILLLHDDTMATGVHGLCFTGSSVFGLGAINGVLTWLRDKQQGLATHFGFVPLVPGACIYDAGVLHTDAVSQTMAQDACERAHAGNIQQGRVGVGVGATIGKCIPEASPMLGGFAQATRVCGDIVMTACVVVNAVGDVIDRDGHIIAGACDAYGAFADCAAYVASGHPLQFFPQENTTLVALFTNAHISGSSLSQLCKMAQAGLARCITPVFTPADGDIIFATSLGDEHADIFLLGQMAVEAIIDAVHLAVT